MKCQSYGGSISEKDAKAEINSLVQEVNQEFRKLSNASNLTVTDIAELFTRNMLQRLGVPIEE